MSCCHASTCVLVSVCVLLQPACLCMSVHLLTVCTLVHSCLINHALTFPCVTLTTCSKWAQTTSSSCTCSQMRSRRRCVGSDCFYLCPAAMSVCYGHMQQEMIALMCSANVGTVLNLRIYIAYSYSYTTLVFMQVEEQYARDVARMHGDGAASGEQDYKSFLKVRCVLSPAFIVYNASQASRIGHSCAVLKVPRVMIQFSASLCGSFLVNLPLHIDGRSCRINLLHSHTHNSI